MTTIPTTAATIAAQGRWSGAAVPVAGSTLRSLFQRTVAASSYVWLAATATVPARTFARMRSGNVLPLRPSMRPPDHVTVEPSIVARQPSGAAAD